MKIKAGFNTVICTNPPEEKTKSGLSLTTGDKKPELGLVYAVGEPVDDAVKPNVKVGDVVVFRKYADNRIFVQGKEYNFIDFKDIVGVLEDGE